MRLQNKVALITGSATGIGKSVAEAFAREGAMLGLYDINESSGMGTLEEITAADGDAVFIHGDVSSSADVKRAVDKVMDQYHRIDILVNNAAFAIKGTIATITEEAWDRQIDVNLKSVYLFSHFVIPIRKI